MKPPNVPSTAEELNALPQYNGKDATPVYSKSDVMKMLKDAKGDHWWLLQRPNGSYCKSTVDD